MILRGSISSGGMIDASNPSVIICSRPLERALGTRALHETEILKFVASQLEDNPGSVQLGPEPCTEHDLCASLPRGVRRADYFIPAGNVSCAGACSHALKDGVFYVEPQFLEVIRRAPGLGKDLTHRQDHTFKEVRLHLRCELFTFMFRS